MADACRGGFTPRGLASVTGGSGQRWAEVGSTLPEEEGSGLGIWDGGQAPLWGSLNICQQKECLNCSHGRVLSAPSCVKQAGHRHNTNPLTHAPVVIGKRNSVPQVSYHLPSSLPFLLLYPFFYTHSFIFQISTIDTITNPVPGVDG